jgi:hypothetical protein
MSVLAQNVGVSSSRCHWMGFTAGPNVREAEPVGMAADASTRGWPGKARTARSTSAYTGKWTRPLELRSSDGARSISARTLRARKVDAVANCSPCIDVPAAAAVAY